MRIADCSEEQVHELWKQSRERMAENTFFTAEEKADLNHSWSLLATSAMHRKVMQVIVDLANIEEAHMEDPFHPGEEDYLRIQADLLDSYGFRNYMILNALDVLGVERDV